MTATDPSTDPTLDQPADGLDAQLEAVTRPQHVGVRLDSVERAIADIAAGKAVVVVDDETRENEGDLVFAASKATPELMAFTIRHSSGVICVPMPAEKLDRLEIPLMTPHNRDAYRTAYTITVDARDGVTTGISAADRAHTARTLADSATEPWELTRPGHVFPLRYREGGVLVRRGHTEAAVDLARLAGLTPAGVLVEVVNDDGTMKRAPQLRAFADEHGLAMISIEDLVRHRRRHAWRHGSDGGVLDLDQRLHRAVVLVRRHTHLHRAHEAGVVVADIGGAFQLHHVPPRQRAVGIAAVQVEGALG